MNEHFLIPEFVISILEFLRSYNAQAFLVGGCVRDMLMQRDLHDYDIATSAKAENMLSWFSQAGYKALPTGIKHGTITVLLDEEPVEITTYRIDQSYQNHRSPDQVVFTAHIEDDLKRRDFTMNAIAFHPKIGIIDPHHGQEDIRQGIVRCVGDPMVRFEEDALRMLRALRFSSQLRFEIESNTWNAIQVHHQDLKYVSKERISDEFNKILMASKVNTLRMLRDANILLEIIPDYASLYDYKQPTKWHIYDVFTHTDVALNHTTEDSLYVKLAIVFHDIGKPLCCTIDEQGSAHYKGHALQSQRIAQHYLKELHYDNATIQRVCDLILYHDYYVKPTRKVLRKYLSKFSNDVGLAFEALDVQIADNHGKNPELAQALIDNVLECKAMISLMEEEKDILHKKDLALNGHDVMRLGYTGKEIGEVLSMLYEWVLEDPTWNTKEALLKRLQKMK
ncbi:MAG: HD domain-containing protein [Longicatena sp.]